MDHFTGHDHDHSHGHDHAHDHAHAHDHGENEYYIEQLLSIFISGAFGVTGILMYRYDMLQWILADMFKIPVLIGGIGLLMLTLFRGFCLWKAVGSDHDDEHANHNHDHTGHNHAEGEECCEEEGHEAHEHGNIYWRIVVLAFPILIFCMGLPNGTFGKDYILKLVGKDKALSSFQRVADKDGDESSYSFSDLSQMAYSPEKRAALAGTRASVKGQFNRIPESTREFGLFHLKMTCCKSDIVTLKARIIADSEPIAAVIKTAYNDLDWIEVHGVLQFVEVAKNKFVVVLEVRDANDLNPTRPVNNE